MYRGLGRSRGRSGHRFDCDDLEGPLNPIFLGYGHVEARCDDVAVQLEKWLIILRPARKVVKTPPPSYVAQHSPTLGMSGPETADAASILFACPFSDVQMAIAI